MWNKSPALQNAFQYAKSLLINAVELKHPNPNYPYAICVDASDHSVGGTLEMQEPSGKWVLLGCFSKHLTPSQKKYSVFKKELYAAHQSTRHFLPEVYGKEFAIFSDHLPLCQAMDSEKIPLHDPQTYRQLLEISQFTRDIRHISGKNNVFPDWLSRGGAGNPKSGTIYEESEENLAIASMETIQIQGISVEALKSLQQECPEIKDIQAGLHPKALKFGYHVINEEELYCELSSNKGPRPFIPLKLRSIIIQSTHSLGHHQAKANIKKVASDYFWPTIKKDITDYVKLCEICKKVNPNKKLVNVGKFQVPDQRMSHVMVDIVGPLPQSYDGYKYILTCIDRTSRHVSGWPLKAASADESAKAFLHNHIALYGLPSHISSDCGANFTASLWKKIMSNLQIELKYAALYRPQSIGLLERTHGPIKKGLIAALLEAGEMHQENWIDHLPWVLLAKNNAYQEDLKASASEMLFGFCGKLPGQLLDDKSNQPSSQSDLQELLSIQRRRNSKPAIQTSSHSKPEKPLPQIPSNITHVYTKQHKATGLQAPYSGPFFIEERLSNSTVKIKVGSNVKGEPIYEVRHLNDLKLANPNSNAAEATRPKRGRPAKLVSEPSKENEEPYETLSGRKPHPDYLKRGPIITKEIFDKWRPEYLGLPPSSDPHPTTPATTDVNNNIASINFTVPPPPYLKQKLHQTSMWSASSQDLFTINQSITRNLLAGNNNCHQPQAN